MSKKTIIRKAVSKAVASARYFKNKKETDMWHTVWHMGKPYDYHLILDDYGENSDLAYEVDIYSVPKKKNGEWGNLNDLVHLHTQTFPYNSSLFGEGEING